MRKVAFLALTVGLLGVAACGITGRPDLVVSGLVPIGTPTRNAQGAVELPLRVTVRNAGAADADASKVSVQVSGLPTDPSTAFVVAFTVEGQQSPWYPVTGPIGENTNVDVDGKIVFHPSVGTGTVNLTATADSCSGEEFPEDFCRVQESNEDNNVSSEVSVTLP